MLSLGTLYYEVGEKQEHFFFKKEKNQKTFAGLWRFSALRACHPETLSINTNQQRGAMSWHYLMSWKCFSFRLTRFFHNAALILIHHSLLLTKHSRKEFINSIQSLAALINYCLVYVKCLLFAILFSLCKFVHTASWKWFLIHNVYLFIYIYFCSILLTFPTLNYINFEFCIV